MSIPTSVVDRAARSEERYLADPGRFAGRESDFAHWVVERLPRWKGAAIVEVGCGAGRDLTFYLTRGYAALGADFSPTAIERARHRVAMLPEPGRSRGRVAHGDALSILRTLPDQSLEAVIANHTYGTIPGPELAMVFAEAGRCLRPGGVHLYAIRTPSDPQAGEGVRVAPDTWLGGPHPVPYRYYALSDCDRLVEAPFERGDRTPKEKGHDLFVADRRR